MPVTAEEAEKKVIDFVNAHAEDFTERERQYLLNNASWGITCDEPYRIFDILRQVYGELGIMQEGKDMHKAFMKLLEENFDIDRNIIEVGGGIVPSLGKQLATKQK